MKVILKVNYDTYPNLKGDSDLWRAVREDQRISTLANQEETRKVQPGQAPVKLEGVF